ncbi:MULTISPECIES: DUF3083 family protein [Pseudomonadati]|uniref:DUF3083 family protein n=1 Tax=Shewanella aestuarii TaxID=1028752 RepID=A0ABT0L305_9GAMM|nr:DUF3083 family protein [Shewanella aestuarii]MCL1118107.1 DUF3083 family protein [Shewanella aestuarii]GGN81803.1 hypothetical protein GCM10009193_28370 [Shewanella aestuarii]
MSVSRQKKVYLPTATRKNQYISVGFPLTDAFLASYTDLENCYYEFSKLVYQVAEKHDLFNVHVIATDKLPMVRFHSEAYCLSTEEQLRFFYNPAHHEANRLHSISGYRAKKLKIVFLATGSELRSNSATFHANVQKFMAEIKPLLPIADIQMKVRDHQHISYDFFAKNKGIKETYGYKLRAVDNRYKRRECNLPEDVSTLNYVTVSIPVGRRIKKQLLSENTTNFGPSYQNVADKFIAATKERQLLRVAMVANGKVPLVRNSKFERLNSTAEFQMVGFDPNAQAPAPILHWEDDKLVEALRFVIVAGKNDSNDEGFGRFMNQVEDAIRSFTNEFDIDKEHIDVILRFHQHLSYKA